MDATCHSCQATSKSTEGEIFSSGGLLRQKWNQRAQFPAGAKIVSGNRAGGVASRDEVAGVGNDRVGQNSRLNQLRGPQVHAGYESRLTPDSHKRRLWLLHPDQCRCEDRQLAISGWDRQSARLECAERPTALVQSTAPQAMSALRRQRGQSKPSQRNLFFGGALGLMIRRDQPSSRTPASHIQRRRVPLATQATSPAPSPQGKP